MNRKVTWKKIQSDDLEWDGTDLKILNGLADGKNRDEIAKDCILSKRTIDTRISKMCDAMMVKGQMAVVLKAIALGIINNPHEPIKRSN